MLNFFNLRLILHEKHGKSLDQSCMRQDWDLIYNPEFIKMIVVSQAERAKVISFNPA